MINLSPKSDEVVRHIRQVEDAYLQQDLMQPHWQDKIEGPEPIRYAIGADIVMLYAAPAEHARRRGQERAIGYGEIFRDDEIEIKKAVAAVLGRYIFFGLQGPLVILPSVAQQLSRIVGALDDQVKNLREPPRAFSQRKIMAVLTKNGRRPTSEELEALNRAHLLDGPLAKLQRIEELFVTRRILNVAKGIGGDGLSPSFLRALTPVTRNEMQEFTTLKQNFLDDLMSFGGRSDKQNAMVAADTMARICIINQRLGGAGRLIYITGDTSVGRVGEQFCLKKEQFFLKHNVSFTAAYVRHPRAFLDEKGALRAAQTESDPKEQSLAATLTLWLGHFTDYPMPTAEGSARRVLSQSVEDRIGELEAADPLWLNDAQHAWAALAKRALEQLGPKSYIDILTEAAGKRNASEFRSVLANYVDRIQTDFRKAFDQFFDRVVISRIALEFPGKAPARERPSLCFESQDHGITRLFHKADECWSENKIFPINEYLIYSKEINEGDGSGYFMNLANAWLLASQGHWKSASILARRALAYSSPEIGERTGPNGREAAYLLAVSLRYCAETVDALIEPRDLLSQFKKILDAENARLNDPAVRADIVEERMLYENHALDFIVHWFGYFRNSDNRSVISQKILDTTDKIVHDFIPFIHNNLIKAAEVEGAHAGQPAVTMPSLKHREAVRRQLLRNAWRHVIGFELSCGEGELNRLQLAWEALQPLRSQNATPIQVWRPDDVEGLDLHVTRSGFGELQDMCCVALFGRSFSERSSALGKLKTLRPVLMTARNRNDGIRTAAHEHPDFDLSRLCVYHFDPERFVGWIDATERAARN